MLPSLTLGDWSRCGCSTVAGWTVGPVLGVWLMQFWSGALFVIVALGAMGMLGLIRRMRLGNARVHVLANNRKVSHNPIVFLRRFFAQPRLVAGWFFAVMRSCGWWVYIVYVGIFAVQNGLGDQVGGIATSLANMGLFVAPLMLRWIQRHSVRKARYALAFSLAAGVSFSRRWFRHGPGPRWRCW